MRSHRRGSYSLEVDQGLVYSRINTTSLAVLLDIPNSTHYWHQNSGPGTPADHRSRGAISASLSPSWSAAEALVPKQFLQLPLPLILKKFIKTKCFMINCFALIDLGLKESAFVHLSSEIPADMHVEKNRDALIASFSQTPLFRWALL